MIEIIFETYLLVGLLFILATTANFKVALFWPMYVIAFLIKGFKISYLECKNLIKFEKTDILNNDIDD